MKENGDFDTVEIAGRALKGKDLLDYLDKIITRAYFSDDKEAKDYMWYLWCGKDSPFFGKDKMTTFERYFIDDKETHKENKIPYYKSIIKKENCDKILKSF